jgi:hypothetical protein
MKRAKLEKTEELPEDTWIQVTNMHFKIKDVLFDIIVYKEDDE